MLRECEWVRGPEKTRKDDKQTKEIKDRETHTETRRADNKRKGLYTETSTRDAMRKPNDIVAHVGGRTLGKARRAFMVPYELPHKLDADSGEAVLGRCGEG